MRYITNAVIPSSGDKSIRAITLADISKILLITGNQALLNILGTLSEASFFISNLISLTSSIIFQIMILHSAPKCLICSSKAKYFFSKNYDSYEGSPFKNGLAVDYWKCAECGFVFSKTHQDMSLENWSKLNTSWHHLFETSDDLSHINQPPYADQALALQILNKNNIVNLPTALDYAAGYGTLGKFIQKYFNVRINSYDRYVQDPSSSEGYISFPNRGQYQLVINSAMFEHVTTRRDLDEVNQFVADDGVLVIHTQICENVPNDPKWFYLEPIVHTAFHTNKSMSVLMKQWGYSASIYSLKARSWYLFKNKYPYLSCLENKVRQINDELQSEYFFYKEGFLDYWKGY